MKKGIKLFLINAAILFGFNILLPLLGVTLFATIFNAIFGDPVIGVYATNVFIRVCLPVITTISICIYHAKNSEERRAYLGALAAEKYDRKTDFQAIIKTKELLTDCIVFLILYVFMFFIAQPPKWIFLVAVFIFPVVDVLHYMKKHKQWASERIRLSSESTSTNG